MKANSKFINLGNDFWGYIRLLSDKLHYSKKINGTSQILAHSKCEIEEYLKTNNISITPQTLDLVVEYFKYRKDVLENYVELQLMDVEESQQRYNRLKQEFVSKYGSPHSPEPLNKQKGKKRNVAFFTCQINLLTEEAIDSFNKKNHSNITCDYDPRGLTFITDENRNLRDTFTRRFDGAIPSIDNPVSVWEIKEYYYTTTFGSRISDGVYETQLDGFEMKNVEGPRPYHNFLIDSHRTWWTMGKSYLCRIIDALNMGLVDEVVFGKEIYKVWQENVTNACEKLIAKSQS